MSNYVYRSSLSYGDYLQAKSFEDGFKTELAANTRAVIASNEELQREHISLSRQVSERVENGVEQLSSDLKQITDGISTVSQGLSELNSTFSWGFSELLTAVGHVNDSLEELVKASKTPAQTWAYEQFEIARDAARQDLYEESLQYLDRAINGYGGNTGYLLEYRFHYLMGVIRIGSIRNRKSAIVNPPEAEKGFLNAAKYAQRDQPKEAARAMLGAGWACYVQGEMERAVQHLEQAIRRNPELAEAQFTLAKVLMHLNQSARALPPLKRAIELDRRYMIKAAGDGDFKLHETEVRHLFETMREEAGKRADGSLKAASEAIRKAEATRVEEFCLSKYVPLTPAIQLHRDATEAAARRTYFDNLDSVSLCDRITFFLRNAFARFKQIAQNDARERIDALEGQLSSRRAKGMGTIWVLLIVVGTLGGCAKGCKEGLAVDEANAHQAQVREAAAQKMIADIRSKGYDPSKLTVDEGRRLGFSADTLPPRDTGHTAVGTLLPYVIICALLAGIIAKIGNSLQKAAIMSGLNSEKSRLESVANQLAP